MPALLPATGCAAAADSEATYSEADVSFNHEMITHHHQTIQPAGVGAELKAGSGFDKQWLTALSGHLEHGVHMAETARKTGKHGPTLELAAQIIKNQNAELAEIAKRLA